jgi:23S rRNA pseudouridine955/2504/2580 synthase
MRAECLSSMRPASCRRQESTLRCCERVTHQLPSLLFWVSEFNPSPKAGFGGKWKPQICGAQGSSARSFDQLPFGSNSISKMNTLSKGSASWQEVDDSAHDQRIDNYLLKILKGVPKSHVYRILRSGEVRVNSRRVDPAYRLQSGDKVRLPPVRTALPAKAAATQKPGPAFAGAVLFEDADLLIVDKPGGIAVHGGSGIARGVIEQLRIERPAAKFLELAHRLDRETSGVLVLAKKRSALTDIHEQMRRGDIEKHYLALVIGDWKDDKRAVRLALHKYVTASGERRVVVDEDSGRESYTIFRRLRRFPGFGLLDAELKTGRTHQIRVHLAHLGFPIAGDDKYGDFTRNKQLSKEGLKRMFLHAASLRLRHPRSGESLEVKAPLAAELRGFLDRLDRGQARP